LITPKKAAGWPRRLGVSDNEVDTSAPSLEECVVRPHDHVRIAGLILTIPSAKASRKNPARKKATQATKARLEA
jgi:hypothetical protein